MLKTKFSNIYLNQKWGDIDINEYFISDVLQLFYNYVYLHTWDGVNYGIIFMNNPNTYTFLTFEPNLIWLF